MKRGWSWGIVALLASACGEEPLPPPPPPPPEQPPPPPPPQEPTPQERLEAARARAAAGDPEAALGEVEAVLPTLAGDPAAWRMALEVALATGDPGAFLDRLAADAPIGGQVRAHHALRARLALAAGRPRRAVEAADALAGEDPESAAAFRAWAALEDPEAVAVEPEEADPEPGAEALVLAAVQPPARTERLLGERTWQRPEARFVHARLLLRAGREDAARPLLEALAGDEDRLLALQALDLLAAHAPDDEARVDAVVRAARLAAGGVDGLQAGNRALAAVDARLARLEVDAALELARALHEAREKAGDAAGGARTRLALATAALEAGDVVGARKESHAVRVAPGAVTEPLLARAVAVELEAADRLGLATTVAELARLAGPWKEAAGVLEQLDAGHVSEAIDALPEQLPEGRLAVHLPLRLAMAAGLAGLDADPLARRAVRAADRLGHRPLQVEAGLVRESLARRAGDARAAQAARKALSALLGAMADPEAAAPLAAELAVRARLSGARASLEGELPQLAAWRALAAGDPLEDGPLAPWARARAAAAAGDLAGAIAGWREATGGPSAWRTGPWEDLSLLDGSSGPRIEDDLDLLARSDMRGAGLAALLLHDWARGRTALEAGFAIGDDPADALEAQPRLDLAAARERLRLRTALWFAGVAEEPAGAREALTGAEQAARAVQAFRRALPPDPVDPTSIQERLDGLAILSYRLGPRTGEAVLVTAQTTRVVPLDDVPALLVTADRLRAAMQGGQALGGKPVSPLYGDHLRRELVDVFAEDLHGIGRYLVLEDRPLWGIGFGILPEQQRGLRFLADIRSIGTAVHTSGGLPPEDAGSLVYLVDLLGLDPFPPTPEAASGLRVPNEVENVGRLFGGGLRVMESGEKATVGLFVEKAPKARYIHLADYHAGDRGAFLLADGPLELSRVRALDLEAQVVVLSGPGSVEAQVRRAQAFRAAGAQTVVASFHVVDPQVRGRFLAAFYEARNRERTVARSLFEAREALQKSVHDDTYFDPSWWGQFVLFGRP